MSGTVHLFPLPQTEEDTRFSFSLAVDVAEVLTQHGYPDMLAARAGGDFATLQRVLHGFLYGMYGTIPPRPSIPDMEVPVTAATPTEQVAPGHTVPCVWDCGYLAESESDLNHHESECEYGIPAGEQG